VAPTSGDIRPETNVSLLGVSAERRNFGGRVSKVYALFPHLRVREKTSPFPLQMRGRIVGRQSPAG